MYRIMLVDDEQNVLNALRRELSGSYEVEAFTSPLAALQRAEAAEFAAVVSDYHMPEMDGVAFLEQFGQRQPDAVRLILSGQADMDALVKAINTTHIYRFLPKPWNEDGLKANLAQALDYREAILGNRRLAETYRQYFAAPPQETARKPYRVLLVGTDENSVAAMRFDLTHHAVDEALYGAILHEMAQRPPGDEHDFQMLVGSFAAPSPALEYLENNRCDLVIADFALPEMDGVTFFAKLRRISPDTACILTGESMTLPSLASAINQVHIDNFLARPWNGYEFKSTVMQTLHHRDLLLENRALADLLRESGEAEDRGQESM